VSRTWIRLVTWPVNMARMPRNRDFLFFFFFLLDEFSPPKDVDRHFVYANPVARRPRRLATLRVASTVQVEIPSPTLRTPTAVAHVAEASGLVCMGGHTAAASPVAQWVSQRIAARELASCK